MGVQNRPQERPRPTKLQPGRRSQGDTFLDKVIPWLIWRGRAGPLIHKGSGWFASIVSSSSYHRNRCSRDDVLRMQGMEAGLSTF